MTPTPRNRNTLPTADDVRSWTTSRLIACYVQVVSADVSSPRSPTGHLRKVYADEIDRRMPVVR
jgi:hypothetical protein